MIIKSDECVSYLITSRRHRTRRPKARLSAGHHPSSTPPTDVRRSVIDQVMIPYLPKALLRDHLVVAAFYTINARGASVS
jgi:hypothetical protein